MKRTFRSGNALKEHDPIKYERLVQLHRVLAGVRPERFHLGAWVHFDADPNTLVTSDNQGATLKPLTSTHECQPLAYERLRSLLTSSEPCGTVACAVGHAFSDPWFQQQGAKLFMDDGAYLRHELGIYYKRPTSRNSYLGWSAVERFFHMTPEEAEFLFLSYSYREWDITPQMVMDRIVEEYGIVTQEG